MVQAARRLGKAAMSADRMSALLLVLILLFVESICLNRFDAWKKAKSNDALVLDLAQGLLARWQELSVGFLPLSPSESIWRYSREWDATDLEEGWKLHVSATILTAGAVLERVAPFLKRHNVLFKAPVSLHELKRINSGVFYDYTQVGKFITVYPRTDEEAVFLAENLHQLTAYTPAPIVPYDQQFRPHSSVYYRYGAFKIIETKDSDGATMLVIRDREGKLVPDLRDAKSPDWRANPFPPTLKAAASADSPLKKQFKIFRALSQRGKGGVYQALDLTDATARYCLVKEGRKHGEVDWDGRDGRWRVKHERKVLPLLLKAAINVPQVYSFFEANENCYLILEYIEGESFDNFLTRRKRRLTLSQALRYGVQIASLMRQIHAAGWLWRDCKPANLIVTKRGILRPIDFEGACPIAAPDFIPWSTSLFAPPALKDKFFKQAEVADDLFTLGANLYFLIEGKLPAVQINDFPKMQRQVPGEIRRIIERLLSFEQAERPPAKMVADKLQTALASFGSERTA